MRKNVIFWLYRNCLGLIRCFTEVKRRSLEGDEPWSKTTNQTQAIPVKPIFILLLCLELMGCIENDPSTYITDDYGYVHHTVHYLLDKRGRGDFPLNIPPSNERHFVFDPKVAAWAAYAADGHRVMTGSASGGQNMCEDVGLPCRTVTGTFHVYRKRGPDCTSGEYPVETTGGAKMPYCMYFFRGFSIHAAYDVPSENVSHGCVRVLPSAAKWLNEEFITIGTRVTVLSYEDENGDGDWLKYEKKH